jgi:hypothetical protein
MLLLVHAEGSLRGVGHLDPKCIFCALTGLSPKELGTRWSLNGGYGRGNDPSKWDPLAIGAAHGWLAVGITAIMAEAQIAASLRARPATALTLPGAASQIATIEIRLHPVASQNAIE